MDFGWHKFISRRQRFSEDINRCNNENRISNLPDALISHILSFLPTKYAVGTTVLSKRWNFLWTSVKNLDFDSSSILNRNYYARSDEITKSFVEFVERVLYLHDGRSIDKFCLSSSYKVCANQIYTWVSTVIPCHLKELQVTSTSACQRDMLSMEVWQVDMPWSLFTCKTLTTLKLSGGCVINLPTCVCLPVLKTLHLNSVIYVDDVSIQKLISGCPVLEDLDIERHKWDGVRVINISSPTLKRFSMQFFLYGYIERCSYKISVSAPNLFYLKLADNMAVEYAVYNIPSLVEAHIGIYKYDFPRSLGLVEVVTHVRVLQLSGKILKVATLLFSDCNRLARWSILLLDSYCIDLLQFMESSEDYELPMFHNVARLELGANKEAGWDYFTELLESMPNLEVLVFPRGLVKRRSLARKPYYEFEWYPPESVPGCLLMSLETIIIHEFFGKNCEMELVEYLLENAKVLKQITIHFLYFKQQESCQRKLLRCLRGSPTCKLELMLKDGFEF